MRVLIDFTGPMGSDTGGATYARYMLPRWEATGDSLMAMFSHGQVPGELRALAATTELPPSRLPGPFGKVFDLHRQLREPLASGDFDVAFFPHSLITAGSGVPSAVAIRSTLHLHYPGQLSFGRRNYRRLATLYTVRRADRIIVPSSALADDLMRFAGAARRRLVVIPHGIDLEAFRPDPEAEVDRWRFLFVSKPWDYKGLGTVLRAFAMLADRSEAGEASLVIADGGVAPVDPGVGPRSMGPGIGRDVWMELATRLGIADRVRMLGRLEHDALREEYARASALVAPTSIESFGHPFLEAAATGCPVIASRGHGIDETIGAVAMQVATHRHDEIAEAMLACGLMDDEERRDMASSLRSWAERFSWDRTLTETRSALGEIAG